MKWYVVESPRWKYADGKFVIKRGWGNGYVAIPPSHVLYKKDYDRVFYLLEDTEYQISVHGGLTYSDFGDGDIAPKDWWVFGFDTSHFQDCMNTWPKERVIEETKELFIQLLEIEWGGL
jgi:hypothetical protein